MAVTVSLLGALILLMQTPSELTQLAQNVTQKDIAASQPIIHPFCSEKFECYSGECYSGRIGDDD